MCRTGSALISAALMAKDASAAASVARPTDSSYTASTASARTWVGQIDTASRNAAAARAPAFHRSNAAPNSNHASASY